jgi:hypothetical protein
VFKNLTHDHVIETNLTYLLIELVQISKPCIDIASSSGLYCNRADVDPNTPDPLFSKKILQHSPIAAPHVQNGLAQPQLPSNYLKARVYRAGAPLLPVSVIVRIFRAELALFEHARGCSEDFPHAKKSTQQKSL